MESAGARRRQRTHQDGEQVAALPLLSQAKRKERGRPVPKFVVDLSLPPEDRYTHVAAQFHDQVSQSDLPGLFEELLCALAGPTWGRWLTSAARLAIRRVYSGEETAELRGISRGTGVDMHVLVAFNVLLDLLLGCTSGGVRVRDDRGDPANSRMVHLRTLDWGMDRLREIVVEIDFVRSQGGPVVATTLTYLGYVGVITGVRKGLSMSLNFRPHHDRTSRWKRLTFRWHQAMVVLGFRPAISSILRRVLLEPSVDDEQLGPAGDGIALLASGEAGADRRIGAVLSELSLSRSTAAYLIFCLPQRVYVVEKDNRSARVRDSDTFLTAYNHDLADETDPAHLAAAAEELAANTDAIGMSDIVAFSLDRKRHLDGLWGRRVKACRRKFGGHTDALGLEDVLKLVKDREISNEETHYAVLMDPESGTILWRRRYDLEN